MTKLVNFKQWTILTANTQKWTNLVNNGQEVTKNWQKKSYPTNSTVRVSNSIRAGHHVTIPSFFPGFGITGFGIGYRVSEPVWGIDRDLFGLNNSSDGSYGGGSGNGHGNSAGGERLPGEGQSVRAEGERLPGERDGAEDHILGCSVDCWECEGEWKDLIRIKWGVLGGCRVIRYILDL